MLCPIVIDAPDQQGRDRDHLTAMIQLLVRDRSKDGQLILAVEDAVGVSGEDATILRVGQGRHRLSGKEAHDDVAAHLRPFLTRMLR
jgi:hypothetical protein